MKRLPFKRARTNSDSVVSYNTTNSSEYQDFKKPIQKSTRRDTEARKLSFDPHSDSGIESDSKRNRIIPSDSGTDINHSYQMKNDEQKKIEASQNSAPECDMIHDHDVNEENLLGSSTLDHHAISTISNAMSGLSTISSPALSKALSTMNGALALNPISNISSSSSSNPISNLSTASYLLHNMSSNSSSCSGSNTGKANSSCSSSCSSRYSSEGKMFFMQHTLDILITLCLYV